MQPDSNNKKNKFDIDVVILWVDGNDLSHKKKMQQYLENDNKWKDKNFRTRFLQVNEIEFAIKSIIKNAPFIRNIFVVTDQQTPSFLSNSNPESPVDYSKIKIIDHKEIFAEFESYLPVFNCRPIESMIHKIQGLAEHFIYFNDDIFLLNKCEPTDFFRKGHPVVRGKWTRYDADIPYKSIHQKLLKLVGKTTKDKKYGYKRGQQFSAKILGFDNYFRIDHTPFALRKSTLINYFNKESQMLLRNIRHKFRHPDQYVLQALANHLEIKNKTCHIVHDYQLTYFGSYKKPLIWYKFRLNKNKNNPNKLFLNMQSLDLCTEHKLKYIMKWLNKTFKISHFY